eukprot:s2233_g8.t2
MNDGELRIDGQDGSAYTLEAFIDEYGGSFEDPPCEWLAAPTAPAARARSRSPRRRDRNVEDETSTGLTELTELWKQRSWSEAGPWVTWKRQDISKP